MQHKHQRLHRKHRRGGSAKHQTGGDWWRQIPRGETIQISSEREFPQIPTGGLGRGSGGDHSVQALAVKTTGVGRSDRATTAI
jgi:hypothetical protein